MRFQLVNNDNDFFFLVAQDQIDCVNIALRNMIAQ